MKILEIISEYYNKISVAIEKMKLTTKEKEYEKQILEANALLADKDLEGAKKMFSDLNQEVPESEYIGKRLKDIEKLEQARDDRKAEYDLTIEECLDHLKSGNVDKGESMLKDATSLAEDPKNGQLQHATGLLNDLKKAARIEKDVADLMKAGDKAFSKKSYLKAIDAFDSVLKMQPDNKEAAVGLSKANQKLPLTDKRGRKKREVSLNELRADALALKEKIDVYKNQQYQKGKSSTRFLRMSKEIAAWLRNGLVD